MKTGTSLFIASVLLMVGCSQRNMEGPDPDILLEVSYDGMKNGFHHPPNEVRMKSYWLWLNGQVTRASISRELEGMKSKGYGGAVICDALAAGKHTSEVPHGPGFASEEWLELLSFAVKEGDRLNLALGLNIQTGWNMGGPTVLPSKAMKMVC